MSKHILAIGAHPDDCEVSIGGTAAKFSARGDHVTFVSVTNGNKGHYSDEYKADPNKLAVRRMEEAKAGAAALGAKFKCLGVSDGEVFVTHELTEAIVEVIRTTGEKGHGPDLVLLCRPCDYHRDHRYSAQAVLDASYMLTVPLYHPRSPYLRQMPVFAYWADSFTEALPFRADVTVDITNVLEQKTDAVAAHESQFFEWLPFNNRSPQIPEGDRTAAVRDYVESRGRRIAAVAKAESSGIEFAEAFQICEYGRKPDEGELSELFPVA